MNARRVHRLDVVTAAANLLILTIIVGSLYIARDVFIPLTLATMLAFLLAPLADRLENRGLGRIPTVAVIAIIAFTVVSLFLWVVGREAAKLADDIPKYQTEIVRKVERFTSLGSGTGRKITGLVQAVGGAITGRHPGSTSESSSSSEHSELSAPNEDPPMPSSMRDGEAAGSEDESDRASAVERGSAEHPLFTVPVTSSRSSMSTIFGAAAAVLGPLTNAGLVTVFVIFMLAARDDLRDRLIRVLSGGRYIVTTKAIDEASRRISRYILAQTIVNSIYGALIGIGLWVIGLTLGGDRGFPNFALWGLLCAVLRFIPYLGPIIAGSFPIFVSLTMFPGFTVFAAVAALITCIELGSNNLLEPYLYGSSTGMSPVAVILAAVFWTWMWGPVGLLLSTPLTASLIVLGKYVPQLKPISVLLGDQAPLPPFVSFYQRLLADDTARAEKIIESSLKENGAEKTADECVFPALRRVRRDRAAMELDATREHALMEQIALIIERTYGAHHAAESNGANSSDPNPESVCDEKSLFVGRIEPLESEPCQVDVVGCAAHHESEETALKLIGYSLARSDLRFPFTGSRSVPTDVENWIIESRPKVIVIAVVPPGGLTQARFLCEQMATECPGAHIIVAYFGKISQYDAMLVRFRRAGAAAFTTSLVQTRAQILSALRSTSHKRFADRRTPAEHQ